MTRHESGFERHHPGRNAEADGDSYDVEISLQPTLRNLWRYRRVIFGLVATMMAVFLFIALLASVSFPVERLGSLGFRLLFDGASEGSYPNGTPFSGAEIVSTPVLTEVFDVNDLGRFGPFEGFQDSIFILQSNPELDLLSYEYQAKLADTRLTSVDRTRIEDEFQRMRESLTDPQFTLNLRQDERAVTMPPSLVSKVLDDTVATWARQAAGRRGALRYDISVLSENVLSKEISEVEDSLIALIVLRTQVMRVLANIEEVSTLPGAALVRVGTNQVSLLEARLELEDILRFEIQPLLGLANVSGLFTEPNLGNLYISDQLFQLLLERDEVEKRVSAVQQSLRAYMLQRGGAPDSGAGSVPGRASVGRDLGSQGLIPQLGESFLDRLVELSTMNSDIEYRQRLTDRVIEESAALAVLEREQDYFEEMSRSLQQAPPSTGMADREAEVLRIRNSFENALEGVAGVVRQVNEIYEELSTHNLNPTTLLYAVTAPFTMRTERALSSRTVGLYGVLVFVLAVFLAPLSCLAHNYFKQEILRQRKRDPESEVGERAAEEGGELVEE